MKFEEWFTAEAGFYKTVLFKTKEFVVLTVIMFGVAFGVGLVIGLLL